jgi:hypothetical protein
MLACFVLFLIWVFGVGGCILDALNHPEPDLRHKDVLASARIAVAFMAIGWCMIIQNKTETLLARLTWTLGLFTLIIHIIVAFWLAHRWSHSAAVEHVREVGGFGGGIVVSYLFVVVWLIDALWWWINPSGHANRSKWVGWLINGFLAFVVINATVVFGVPEWRVPYALVFGVPMVACFIWRAKYQRF